MKKKYIIFFLICLFLVGNKFNTNIADSENNISLSAEYNKYVDFDINKIPDRMFYKLNQNCSYKIYNEKDILKIIHNETVGLKIYYDNDIEDLGDVEGGLNHSSWDTNVYLIRENGNYYILIDKLYNNDCRYYHFYLLHDNKINLVEENIGRIDFVGYDYIIGYTDLGMIGYQQCEFKKIFRNGKFELDGEYKVVEDYGNYPFWVYYTLVKDLKCEEYDNGTNRYKNKLLKVGTKIRSLSTDAKTYINIEVEDGRKGKVKVDKVEGMNESICRDFIVDGQLFMDYYFLDGTKNTSEVYSPMPVY